MPRYNEIDFFDKFPQKETDAVCKKKSRRVTNLEPGVDLQAILEYIAEYEGLLGALSLRDINYAFTPRQMNRENILKIVLDVLEERSKFQIKMKNKEEGRHLHELKYFDFCSFFMAYFQQKFPVRVKMEKTLINFLWGIEVLIPSDKFLRLFSNLIKRASSRQETLLNLLMVKDFVKEHLKKQSKIKYVNLQEHGDKFQHSNKLVELVRTILGGYDESFQVFYEEKFLTSKGDVEYVKIFDFIAIATQCFDDLHSEGIKASLKKPIFSSSTKSKGTSHHELKSLHDNHMLKCYGLSPGKRDQTGKMQDRAKMMKSNVNWYLWSDNPGQQGPQSARKRDRELTGKEIGEFFSVEMDDKIKKLKELSNRKKRLAQDSQSKNPYDNLCEQSKKIIDQLEISTDLGKNPPIQSEVQTSSRFDPFREREELEVFGAFDRLSIGPDDGRELPIMKRIQRLDQEEREENIAKESWNKEPDPQIEQIREWFEEDLTQQTVG